MAFNNIGPRVVVERGQSVTWEYSFGANKDVGLQIAGPNVFAAPGHLGILLASGQGKVILGIDKCNYRVTITNVSNTQRAIHNLQIGGVV
jgi:hypothetical protein